MAKKSNRTKLKIKLEIDSLIITIEDGKKPQIEVGDIRYEISETAVSDTFICTVCNNKVAYDADFQSYWCGSCMTYVKAKAS